MSVRRRKVKERLEREKQHSDMIQRWNESLEDRRSMLLAVVTEYRERCPDHEISLIDGIISDLQPRENTAQLPGNSR